LENRSNVSPAKQDLDIYWTQEMADVLETWGEGNAWTEIEYLMVNCKGRVLDIACGTGKTMQILSKYQALDIFGVDISNLLIDQAIARGIPKDRLMLGDATKLNFSDDHFDYGYSIGSLEHFTSNGIDECIRECRRVVKAASFHHVPVSRSQADEGWITPNQSYFNNSEQWWRNKFAAVFSRVYVLGSRWDDQISVGKWFICSK
jgi:ubiquinone/menaquinone biosynthesis C-methylase UbiE